MTRYQGRTENFISFAYAIKKLPKRVKKKKVLETLIKSAESGKGNLPAGWVVIWRWRNTAGGRLRSDNFTNVVKNSRAQFLMLMGKRLRRDLVSLGFPEPEFKKVRAATDREAAAVENEREPFEEKNQEREIKRKRKKRHAAKTTNRKASKKVNRTKAKRSKRTHDEN